MDFTEEIKPIEYNKEAETNPKFPMPDTPTTKPLIQDLPNINSLSCGVGSKSIHLDKQGLWLGSNSFDDAPFKVGIDGSFSGSSGGVASTDLVTILQAVYPIGSIYTSVVSTNPLSIFGFGTWTAFGAGKVLVGQNGVDSDFDTAEEIGGAKTATLAETNLAAHTHDVNPASFNTASGGAHQHLVGRREMRVYDAGSAWTGVRPEGYTYDAKDVYVGPTDGGTHLHAIDVPNTTSTSVGSGTAFSIMNPYLVVYFWKRTA